MRVQPFRLLEISWSRGVSAVKSCDFFIGLFFGFFLLLLLTGRTLVPKIPIVFWRNYQTPLTGSPAMYQRDGALWMKRNLYSRDHGKGTNASLSDAERLAKKTRVLVWVMTSQSNLGSKAKAIKETWGKRCNALIFFSSKTDPSFPAVGLNVAEGRGHLTAKTMAAFRYLYENHFNDADWFMKADDDTFVVPENLRYYLSDKNSSEPVYYGSLFRKNVEQGYYSGGGGYVISKEALRRFGKQAINSELCSEDGNDEDVDWGKCMEKLGVRTSYSTDKQGRTLFHSMDPNVHYFGKYSYWLQRYTAARAWGEGISPKAISFHYVTPDQMRMLTFYLYHWRPHGLPNSDNNS